MSFSLCGADIYYVIVPADKASNNVVFVCKAYYFSCLKQELDLDVSITNSTYQWTNFSKDEILANHRSVLSSFNIERSRLRGLVLIIGANY